MPNPINSKKVLIFGTFDGVHDGHLSFIREAKSIGDHVIAVVARDSMVLDMKGKLPINNEIDRINALLEVPEIDRVLLGDLEMSTYNVLKEVDPDIVFLGYDQQALHDDISDKIKKGELKSMDLVYGTPHKPDTHHSSILNKNTKTEE